MLRILLILFLLCSGTVNAGAQTILLVGDSLSAAYGMPADAGWVALLQQRLEAEQYPHRLVNASISGDTSREVLIRREDFKSANNKTLEWSKIATFEVTIIDLESREKLDLTSPKGQAFVQTIKLVD